jgi:ABC-type uncharacterized transport system involved in gliding motility auxiliary subunit
VTEPTKDGATGGPAAARPGLSRRAVEGSLWSAGAMLVLALVLIVNYLGGKYYQRWDWTGTKLYSLSEKSLSVLAGLDRDIRATLVLQPGSSLYDPAKELLERYAARSARFTVRAVDPDRNLIEAQRLVEELELTEGVAVVFEAGGDRRVIEQSALAEFDYSGMQFGAQPTMTEFKGEEAFTGAVLELVEQRKPKVLATTGHGERSLDDLGDGGLSRVRELLGKENLTLESWGSLGQAEVPDGTDLLVVAGAKVNFVAPELEAFGRYLDRGGRMLVMLDPELDAEGGVTKTGLEAWLAGRGVELGDDLVVDPSATLPFFGAETIFVRALGSHPIVASLGQADYPVIFGLARSARPGSVPADFEATTLLQTTAEGWGERDLANLGAVAKGADDTAGPVPVGVAVAARAPAPEPAHDELELDVEPEAGAEESATASAPESAKWRLVVFGDSDFATNGQLANVGNPTLVANAFNWLLERENLLGIGPKKPEQVRLSLTPGQVTAVWLGTLLGMPALAVAGGVAVWWRRRR